MERILPQNGELEMQLLGGIMVDADPRAWFEMASGIVSGKMFWFDHHRHIFKAMRAVYDRGQVPDALAILDELRSTQMLDAVGGSGIIMGLVNSVASGAGTETYAERVLDKWQLREIIRICLETQRRAYEQDESPDAVVYAAQQALEAIMGHSAGGDGILTAEQFIQQEAERWEESFGQSEIPGATTGFQRLNRLTGGFQRGELWVWTAPTNTGKSKLLCYSLVQAALEGQTAGIISIDMNRHKLFKYLLPPILSLTGRPTHPDDIFNPVTFDEQDKAIFRDEMFRVDLAGKLLVVPKPRSTTVAAVEGCVRKLVKAGASVIAIDQAQNFSDYRADEHGDIARIVARTKHWAWHYNVCIVLVHQVGREGYKNPTIKDMQGSSAFEQFSDVLVAFLDIERAKGADQPQNPRDIIIKLLKTREETTQNMKTSFDFARGVQVR